MHYELPKTLFWHGLQYIWFAGLGERPDGAGRAWRAHRGRGRCERAAKERGEISPGGHQQDACAVPLTEEHHKFYSIQKRPKVYHTIWKVPNVLQGGMHPLRIIGLAVVRACLDVSYSAFRDT